MKDLFIKQSEKDSKYINLRLNSQSTALNTKF